MASSFISKDDFITIITVAALDNLTDGNDSIIDTMVLEALGEMMAYLEGLYDTAILLSAGGLLHPSLQMYCKDIVLYHLHSRHHLRPMPEIRLKRYENALHWLKDIQEQKIDPFAFIDAEGFTKSIVKTGGNAKRENHQV